MVSSKRMYVFKQITRNTNPYNYMTKIVYIAHAIAGDIENNLSDLRRILRKINLECPYTVIPIAPYYADVVSLNDTVPDERKRGMHNDATLIKCGLISEIWLTGPRISSGMQAEIDLAKTLNIPVIDFINSL